MKKKTKKPLFDKRAPGGKTIFYGAIIIIIGACINAFASWSLVVGTFLGMAAVGDVLGETLNLCLQVGLSLKSHDPSQRANGFLTLAGGIIITFTKEILNMITG